MILELVLTVCLTSPSPQADPMPCHDERLRLVDPDISLLQCQMGVAATLPGLVEWARAHPKYRVAAWSCREYVPEKDL